MQSLNVNIIDALPPTQRFMLLYAIQKKLHSLKSIIVS